MLEATTHTVPLVLEVLLPLGPLMVIIKVNTVMRQASTEDNKAHTTRLADTRIKITATKTTITGSMLLLMPKVGRTTLIQGKLATTKTYLARNNPFRPSSTMTHMQVTNITMIVTATVVPTTPRWRGRTHYM
jgi:hypothetical protein